MSIDRDLSEIRRKINADPDNSDAQRQLKSLSSRIHFLQKQQILNLFETKYNFKGLEVEIQLDGIASVRIKTCKPGIVIGRKAL